MTTPNNIADTVRALFADGSLLVKQEVALAKAEASEKMEQVQTGLIAIVGALLLAVVALFILVSALVSALAALFVQMFGMTDPGAASLSALVIGVVLAIIAYVSFKAGQSRLSAENLTPSRTIRSVREDAQTIREAA